MKHRLMANGDVRIAMTADQLRAIRLGLGRLTLTNGNVDAYNAYVDLADIDEDINGELGWED